MRFNQHGPTVTASVLQYVSYFCIAGTGDSGVRYMLKSEHRLLAGLTPGVRVFMFNYALEFFCRLIHLADAHLSQTNSARVFLSEEQIEIRPGRPLLLL